MGPLLPLLKEEKKIIGFTMHSQRQQPKLFFVCQGFGGFQLQYHYLAILLQPSKEITSVMLEVCCMCSASTVLLFLLPWQSSDILHEEIS